MSEDVYLRFETLLHEHNVTPYKVSKETGIATSTLSNWKNKISTPKQDKLQKIAEYFGVSLEWLLNGIETKKCDELYNQNGEVADAAKCCELIEKCHGSDALKLVSMFVQLDSTDRIKILERTEMLLEDEKYSIKKELRNA